MTSAREFVDFWVENCVHSDEEMAHRRGRLEIQKLADRLLVAANYQGFSKEQIESEVGDLFSYIRASVDAQNSSETTRLKLDRM